jgi:hypothetical protein
MAFRPPGDLFGGAGRADAAAAVAAFGAEVDDPVGGLDDVEVVLDDEDGITEADEVVEDLQEIADVFEVQAGCWLVENVKSSAGVGFCQFAGEFDALGFAAG